MGLDQYMITKMSGFVIYIWIVWLIFFYRIGLSQIKIGYWEVLVKNENEMFAANESL